MNTPPKLSTIRPNSHFMWSHYSHVIAQGFGSGLSPIMPGTTGTLFAWCSYVVLTERWSAVFTPTLWAMIIVIGFFIGIWACEKTGRDLGAPDHGSMVWDEIIAFWLVLLFVMPAGWKMQCWAFILFRFFDMVKPPPIRYFDRYIKGGLGVMWDDVVAAFYTLLVLSFYFSFNK